MSKVQSAPSLHFFFAEKIFLLFEILQLLKSFGFAQIVGFLCPEEITLIERAKNVAILFHD